MFTVGKEYRHTRSGQVCRVDRVFADRQRLRITLANGQELDEVPYHDLQDLQPEAGGLPAPAPEPESPAEAESATEAAPPEPPRRGLQTPEGFRRRLRGEEAP